MPPHILTQHDQFSLGVEQSGSVQSTRAVEDALRRLQGVGESAQHLGVEKKSRIGPPDAVCFHSFYGSLAADAATGGHEEVATRPLGVKCRPGELDMHDVAARLLARRVAVLCLAVIQGHDLFASFDQAFTEEEAGGQFQVVSRSAHGNAEGRCIESDLKGFFRDKAVLYAAHLPVLPFRDLRHVDAA